jgi:hypothetical protein
MRVSLLLSSIIYFVQCWNPRILTGSFKSIVRYHIESIVNQEKDIEIKVNQKINIRIITTIDKESFETVETFLLDDIMNKMLSRYLKMGYE